jgi:hypothetical protein
MSERINCLLLSINYRDIKFEESNTKFYFVLNKETLKGSIVSTTLKIKDTIKRKYNRVFKYDDLADKLIDCYPNAYELYSGNLKGKLCKVTVSLCEMPSIRGSFQ